MDKLTEFLTLWYIKYGTEPQDFYGDIYDDTNNVVELAYIQCTHSMGYYVEHGYFHVQERMYHLTQKSIDLIKERMNAQSN